MADRPVLKRKLGREPKAVGTAVAGRGLLRVALGDGRWAAMLSTSCSYLNSIEGAHQGISTRDRI
jgi:hypothetical protein